MKPLNFEGNDQHMIFQYMRMREGPNYFMCKYKRSSVLRQDPKDAWRVLGAAKFTETGKALKEWCLSMHQQWVLDRQEQEEGRADTSFASEALLVNDSQHEAMAEEDPTHNTKMVT